MQRAEEIRPSFKLRNAIPKLASDTTSVDEKKKLVKEDSFKDGVGNVKAKAKKHQVLEGELKSNNAQLKNIVRTGQQMINRNHFKSQDIGGELETLNQAWEELQESVKDQVNTRF